MAKFDSKRYLDEFKGHELLAKEAVSSFLETYPGSIKQLAEAISSRDIHKTKLIAHRFRGAIANFRITTVNKLISDLEAAIGKMDFGEVDDLFEKLQSEMEDSLSDLKRFIA